MARLVPLLLLLTVGACGEVHRPTLCVFTAKESTQPDAVDATQCPSATTILPGETLYVLHQLPEGAEVDEGVTLTISSPCRGSTITTKQHYSDRRVLYTAVAPAGSDCSLQVAAQILNVTDRFVSRPARDDCKAVCTDVEADAATSDNEKDSAP